MVKTMRKTSFIILTIFALIFLASNTANACWCRKDSEETNTPKKLRKVIEKTYNNSAIVFTATAIEQNGDYLKFKVTKIWKGKELSEILFTSVNYVYWSSIKNRDGVFIDSCAYGFKLGESYLIYAVIENGKYEVGKCGRTQVLSEATKDIEELNLLVENKKKRKS